MFPVPGHRRGLSQLLNLFAQDWELYQLAWGNSRGAHLSGNITSLLAFTQDKTKVLILAHEGQNPGAIPVAQWSAGRHSHLCILNKCVKLPFPEKASSVCPNLLSWDVKAIQPTSLGSAQNLNHQGHLLMSAVFDLRGSEQALQTNFLSWLLGSRSSFIKPGSWRVLQPSELWHRLANFCPQQIIKCPSISVLATLFADRKQFSEESTQAGWFSDTNLKHCYKTWVRSILRKVQPITRVRLFEGFYIVC